MAEALVSSEPPRDHYRLVVLTSFGNKGQPERDLSLATGVAFTRKQEVIVADPSYNRIQIFDTRGRLRRVIKSSIPGANMFHNPSKVAVNRRNGLIYVTEEASNYGIKVINPNGFFSKTIGKDECYTNVMALTVDDKNNILLLEQAESKLVTMSFINKNGNSKRRKLTETVISPTGLAAYEGKVYISDENADFVKIFDYEGNEVGQFATLTQRAFGVCMSDDGQVLVGTYGFNDFLLSKFKTDGSFVSVHKSRTYHHAIRNMAILGDAVVLATCDGVYLYGPREDQKDVQAPYHLIHRNKMNLQHTFPLLDYCGRLTTLPKGVATWSQSCTDIIYVSDQQHGLIQMFNSSGENLGQFGSGLMNPGKINVNPRHNNVLVIDDWPEPHIVIFNCCGELVTKIGTGDLIRPVNFAVDKCGKIFVIEYNSGSLKVFDQFGSRLYLVNCKGARFPTDIAISKKNEIFMAEKENHRIHVYNYSGELLRRIGNYSVTRYPAFVAIVREGLIVVADRSKHINLTYFTEEGNFVEAYRSNIEHTTCNDICVMSDGSILVASDGVCCQIFIYHTSV